MGKVYAHGHHESVLRSHEWRTADNSAAYLLPHLRPGQRVLDVGAGPGTITVDLAELVAPGEVRGVDAEAGIVAQAAALAAERGLTTVSFAVGDAYALDAEDGSVDVVHAHQVMHHLARPVDALREFRRVVTPGGVVAVREIDWEGVIWYPQIPALDEWLDVFLRMQRALEGEPAAGRRLKAWAREAGYTDITASASVWLFESDTDRAWWGASWAERVLHSSYADHSIGQGVTDRDGLERIAAGWREWAASADGWLLLPHGEIIARG